MSPPDVTPLSLEVGQIFRVGGQGVTITPKTVQVEIVWLEEGHVHYRIVGETAVKQTPQARFLEIVGKNAVRSS
jgi:hypothetical protein|nr:hypothetical protein [Neorhizobium tomejilense]